MGYNTDFWGEVSIEPTLSAAEVDFLNRFTSHHGRQENVYGDPEEYPSTYCQWVPTKDGMFLEWDGNEKFYEPAAWMKYLIVHFLQENCRASQPSYNLPFMTGGHVLNGIIDAQGDESDDRYRILVKDNHVFYWPTEPETFKEEAKVEIYLDA